MRATASRADWRDAAADSDGLVGPAARACDASAASAPIRASEAKRCRRKRLSASRPSLADELERDVHFAGAAGELPALDLVLEAFAGDGVVPRRRRARH